MFAPRQPHQRAEHQDSTPRPRRLRIPKWWKREDDPHMIIPASVMTSAGGLFILCSLLAAINHSDFFTAVFLLLGCALILLGCPVLLFALIGWTANHFIYAKRYCGCCTFYQAKGAEYHVGLCRCTPRETFVPRNHICISFRYSERAMVRDRLWQQRHVFDQIRSIQIDSDQAGSDD
jgi:hypothetical protein